MKNREMKLFLTTLLVLSILSLSLVSSAVTTINSPTTSGNIVCGNQTFNVNVNSTWAESLVNLSFYVGSVSTANTSWTLVGSNNSLNMSLLGNKSVTTIDFINSKIEDSNDYVINVTAINSTGARLMLGEDTRTSIKVDCSVPTAPSSLTPTSDTDGTVTFSSVVSGVKTTGCTLLFTGINPGNPSYTMTHSGNTCTYDLSVAEQNYNWFVRASDGTNTSDSSSQNINVDISSGSIKGKALLSSGNAQISNDGKTLSIVGDGLLNKPVAIVGIIFAVVIFVGVVGFLIFRRK